MNFKVMIKSAGVGLAFFCMVGHAHASNIMVNSATPFAEGASVREAVKLECQLGTKLPSFIKEFSVKEGVDVELTSNPLDKVKGKALFLEITHVHASGGGAFSGPKSVSVAGKLLENGKVISRFTATRYSGGGMFGGFKGTCSIAGRCVKTLGSDIVKWLKNPVNEAHLGDS